MKLTRLAALLLPLCLLACGESPTKPAATTPAPASEVPQGSPAKTAFRIFVPPADAHAAPGLQAGAQQYLSEKFKSFEAVVETRGGTFDWKRTGALIVFRQPELTPAKPAGMTLYVPLVLVDAAAAPESAFVIQTDGGASGTIQLPGPDVLKGVKDGTAASVQVVDTVEIGRKAAQVAHQAIKGEGKLPEGFSQRTTVPPFTITKDNLNDPKVKLLLGEK